MTEAPGIAHYRVEDRVAVLRIASPPVNALGHAVRIALCDGVTRALGDETADAVVLICGGRTFFAGADVTEIGKPILPPLLADVIAKFEGAAKPIVSALHGTALGGGLELALAGHHRIAVPSAMVGLPEVALGLLPGAGGTQRTPRLIGVEAAVEMIGLGRPISAPDAVTMGLIDRLAPEGGLEPAAIAFAREIVASGAPLRRLRDLPTDLDVEAAREVFARFRADHPELFVGLKAADGVLEAIEAAVTLPFDEGLERERAISRRLIAGPESAAQRHLFFAERAAAKLPGAEREKAAEGDVQIIDAEGGIDAYRAAIRGATAETVIATRFLDQLDALAEGLADPAVLVGMAATEGVTEIVVGNRTGTGPALRAMAEARRRGVPAVFVAPGPGRVVARLRDAITRSVAELVDSNVPAGDVAATGRAFGFRDALLPAGDGQADAGIERRLLRPLLAEARAMLANGVAKRSSDIDFAAVRAGLWPVWRGGPAFMAERSETPPDRAAA